MASNLSRRPEIKKRFGGISDSTLYQWIKNGLMVRPVHLGPNTAAWPEDEIDALIAARRAGKSDADVRSLVSQLHEARKATA